jgi:carbonyl reductase 1
MSKVAIVTGANQGLGFALVRGLCKALPAGSTVYLTARDVAKGQASVALLRREGLEPSFHQLDVTDPASVARLAEVIQNRHGGVDIVISNAGARIRKDTPPGEQVRAFIDTNNIGTSRMIAAFRELLSDGGRFLVVASGFGQLKRLSPEIQQRFRDNASDIAALDRIMLDYVTQVEAGSDIAKGWPEWINVPSKVGQVAVMRAFAEQMKPRASTRNIIISAVCPGLVDTDASRPWFADMSGAKSPDDAAKDLVWLAVDGSHTRDAYGELVQHRKILAWL